MKIEALILSAIACAGLAGCASEQSSAARATPPPPSVETRVTETSSSVSETEVTTVRVTVVSVDYDDRIVTVRGPKGKVVELKVSDQVHNLAQVKPGDQVVAKYYESVAIEVKKPGTVQPGATEASGIKRSAFGEKPSGMAARTQTVVATILHIDRASQMVTLKGPTGKVVEVHVKDPTRLERVKKGDRVEITYTEALAISVDAVAQR